ncbi:hypothetical protein A6A04_10000 [Paramagnetospirillum marisnigri]|uniref:histidine kinase n=1 Tax=Paramagnetospirillum marisnigri TaxID=1285242 RepID=A0A178M434_9PROT|nr:ATP-binding protein [Paramagnetospirillum marisnigri]OAN43019.1 hypothetical protein A6A04_10000 [Paramagnetospirillum marisnigri]
MSFRTKTILGIALLQALLLALLLGSTVEVMWRSGGVELDRRADMAARLIGAAAADAMISQDYATLAAMVGEAARSSGVTLLRLLDENGRLLAEGGSVSAAEVVEKRLPVFVGGHGFGQVHVGLDTRELNRAVKEAGGRLLAIGLGGMALTGLFSWILGTYLTTGLERLRVVGNLLASGDLDARVAVDGRDELAETGLAFNAMATRIQELVGKLSEEEATLRAFSEASSDWYWETDRIHRISWLSGSFPMVVRADASEFIGRVGWGDGLTDRPRDLTAIHSFLENITAHRRFRDFRLWIGQGKTAQWISLSGAPRYDESGSFIGYRGSGTNITSQSDAAMQLRLFSRIVEQSPVSVVVTDPKGTIQHVNQRFTQVTGFAASEVIGHTPSLVSSGETPKSTYAELWRTISDGRVWQGELLNRRKNGELYWEEAAIFPILDDMGEIAHFVGIKEDISGRKIGEAELAARTQLVQRHYESLRALSDIAALPGGAEEQLTQALALGSCHLGLPLGIISAVQDDTYTVLHHVAPDGVTLADGQSFPLGQTYCAITLEALDVVAIPNMGQSVHGGHPCYSAFGLEAYVGAPVTVRGTRFGTINFSSPDPYSRGFDDGDVEFMRLLARWVGAVMDRDLSRRDILAAKEEAEAAQASLARQAEKLADINAELEQFAYVASHDLRQPLRMVTSYLTLIRRGMGDAITDEMAEYYGFAINGAKRMDALIVALLDYSRTGRSEEPFELLPLADIVEQSLVNLKVAVKEAGAAVSLADGLPSLRGHSTELIRLFQNLIGNAVKYRAPDRPPVIVLDWLDRGREWEIRVRDNGIGIPPEHRDRIFGIFQRLVRQDEYEGAGIGLSICRKIMTRHGGRIWVEPAPGGGSIFSVSFPK